MTTPGDRFRDFYNRALPRVYSYFHQRVGADRDLAARLTESTISSLVGEWPLDGVDDPVGYAVVVARAQLVDHLRNEARSPRRLIRSTAPVATDAADRDASESELRLHAALRRLPPQERAAVMLRHIDDLGHAEVAAALDKSGRATEALLARAEQRLVDALEDPGDA